MDTLYDADSNAMLKLKFRKLHSKVADNVNVTNIIEFLFQEGVLDHWDVRALQRQSNPQQQCRDLLMLLHSSQHPQAFVQLYRAIRNEPHLQWLVEYCEESSDQSLQEENLGKLAGNCHFSAITIAYYCAVY